MTWLRLSINVELGRPDPDPHDSAVDALVDHGPPPEARPIGFLPPSDPTRRSED